MSNRRSAWIDRRGQRGADAAIDQVIERQMQAGEQVQQLVDELIEDSPYQARQSFSTESVEELAQGMREAGFQGVLIVRPHSDPVKRRRGIVQLVYGHRRRVAWRQVCAERESPCLLPVVVREVNEAQLLTIGAQENLQRLDLDPVEEAQIVAWHERMFFDKNQAEIGAMLGKSSDWVSVRSRIHKLPDALKARLRLRPRAIAQMLELGPYYAQQPALVIALADRVVQENLTVASLRKLVRNPKYPESNQRSDREEEHNRRVDATSVHDITISASTDSLDPPLSRVSHDPLPSQDLSISADRDVTDHELTDLVLLERAVDILMAIASRTDTLPMTRHSQRLIDQAEQALTALRLAFVGQTGDVDPDDGLSF